VKRAAGLGVLVALLAVAAPAHAAFPGANGKIAFEHMYDIWSMNPDGTGQVNLTHSADVEEHPVWSPDGRKIAFYSERNPSGIWIMNPDGTDQTPIASGAEPAWSPDGTKIAFDCSRGGNGEICVMNADGSGQIDLTNNPAADGGPSWSPDGRRIVFASNRDYLGTEEFDVELYVMNADGSDQARLTYDSVINFGPDWSPDGSKIAFDTGLDGTIVISVINADGTGEHRLTTVGNEDRDPSWSPDGTKIVFLSNREVVDAGPGGIYVMNSDGTVQTPIPDGDGVYPDWQPLPFKNRAKQCKGEGKRGRDFGKCVSGR
jgi:tol-pal system beta propeller repeat protein TolB